MCAESSGKKNKKNIFAGVIAALVVAGLVWWALASDNGTDNDKGKVKQEFTELQVVQFYLHLPERDYIVGRDNPGFEKVVDITGEIVASIIKPGVNPVTGTDDVEEALYQLQRDNISISAWLMSPQKISVAGAKGKDRQTIETDRIYIILGGRHMGTVMTKVPGAQQWLAWEVSKDSMTKLVELVRSGNL